MNTNVKIVPYMEFYRVDDKSNDVYICIQNATQHEDVKLCEREKYRPLREEYYDMTIVRKELYEVVKNDIWLKEAMEEKNQIDFYKKGYYSVAFFEKLWNNKKYFKNKVCMWRSEDYFRYLTDKPIIENGYIKSCDNRRYKFKYKGM